MRQEHTLHKALLLIGTSTLWKNAEYSAIATDENNGIAVDLLSYYEPHHSAVENLSTALGNLLLKFKDLVRAFNNLRSGGRNHENFLSALEQNEVHFEGGPAMAMRRTYVMGDDTTIAIPKKIWETMLPSLQTQVAAESLKASKCKINEEPGTEYMSVADIGPIVGSLGQEEFWQLLRQSALTAGYQEHDPVRVYHQVTCAIKCLSDPEAAPPTIFESHTALQVYAPNGLSGTVPCTRLIPTTEDYVCLPAKPDQPISAKYPSFLLKHSTRKKIYDQAAQFINKNEAKIKAENKTIPFKPATKNICGRAKKRTAKKRLIIQPTLDTTYRPLNKIGHYKIVRSASLEDLQQGITEKFTAAVAMKFPIHGDAYIFAPFDPNNEIERLYNFQKLRDALVAKALDRCHYKVPIIVMNLNGCYDDARDLHVAYANDGYNKAFELSSVHQNLGKNKVIVTAPKIEHIALSDMDILNGDNDYHMVSAAEEILDFRLKSYHRITAPKQETQSGGMPSPANVFSVSGYASASSDRLEDHQNGYIVGRICAELEIPLKTGGGDQHSMWSFIDGYNAYRKSGKSHLTCVSTHDIVQVETAEGHLPPCDFWELHDHIGPRKTTLEKSQLHISIGGGDGTGQETGSNHLLLRLKNLHPDHYANRTIIYIGKTASMHAEIISNIGREKFDALRQDPYALAEEGLYLFDDAEAAEPAIRMCKTQFENQQRHHKKRDKSPKLVA